jgi:hypothetical protein
VHSSLLHPRLGYLKLPPPAVERITVEGVSVRAHGGALLPGYLAVHLATHQFVPLLWILDLATLWQGLDAHARDASLRAAERQGVDRYLAWALRRVDALDRLKDGDHSRLPLLGLRATRRTAGHPMWRHLVLAPSNAARRAALSDWVWPSWMRETYGASPVGFARRAIRHAGSLFPRRRRLP